MCLTGSLPVALVFDVQFTCCTCVYQAAYLLRIAILEDHLFLLCHILRCPTSVAKWAVGLIQVPQDSGTVGELSSFQTPLFDHILAVLDVFLSHPE